MNTLDEACDHFNDTANGTKKSYSLVTNQRAFDLIQQNQPLHGLLILSLKNTYEGTKRDLCESPRLAAQPDQYAELAGLLIQAKGCYF